MGLEGTHREESVEERILPLEEVARQFMFMGAVITNNGTCVDFYHLAKRGPIHPSCVESLKNMTVGKMRALRQAFEDGRIDENRLFEVLTSGN